MRNTRHSIRQLLSLVGTGLMLAGVFEGPALQEASAEVLESFVYQNDWVAQHPWGSQNPWGQQDYPGQRDPWGPQDHWGYGHDRPPRRSGYGLPDRYTIHTGKKCELRCERIRGTREYSCREYRC